VSVEAKPAVLWATIAFATFALVEGPRWPGGAARLDPLSPMAREVERALVAGRPEDALPIALDLRTAFPRDPLVPYWLGRVYRALERPDAEAAAWEDFARLSSELDEACPAAPEAYEALGDADRALAWYERCAASRPEDPERLIDLAEAWERRGDPVRALEGYRRAAALDPSSPAAVRRIPARAAVEEP
jgi:tetratricopeptide (TPR) repeat protein